MMKLAIISCVVLTANCMVLHQPQSPYTLGLQYYDTPNYNFAYEVNDAHSGDLKSQQESRRGDTVLGQYSLLQPDGIRRTVDYRADELAGFRAIVNNEARGPQQQQHQQQQQQQQHQEQQHQQQQYQQHQQPTEPQRQNLAAYIWPASTPSATPAPAVAISRSSFVQTFSHGNGNANPWP